MENKSPNKDVADIYFLSHSFIFIGYWIAFVLVRVAKAGGRVQIFRTPGIVVVIVRYSGVNIRNRANDFQLYWPCVVRTGPFSYNYFLLTRTHHKKVQILENITIPSGNHRHRKKYAQHKNKISH